MERLWEMTKKWLFPSWKWTFPLVVLSTAGLLFVFLRGNQESPVAYAVYLLSFYTLVAGTAAVIRTGRNIWRRIIAIPLVQKWREDAYWRVKMGLLLSLLVNLCYAGLRVIGAVLYASFWEGALGAYYILLCAVRLFLLRQIPLSAGHAKPAAELQSYRRAGWLLVGLDLVLTVIAVQIVRDGQGYHYPGTVIYAAAAYSFYCLIQAIIHAVQYRKFHSPVLSAAKAVSLTTALVSIFSLETAMLAQFGGEPQFQFIMTAATGAGVCALVLGIAIYMVATACRAAKKNSKGEIP